MSPRRAERSPHERPLARAAATLAAFVAIYAAALAEYVYASVRTGPASGELARVGAVQAAGRWIEQLVARDPAALGRGAIDGAFGATHGAGTFPVLLGGYFTASIGRRVEPWLGALTRERLGHLAVAALVPPLAWLLARALASPRAALAAAAALLLVPRFAHEAAIGGAAPLAAAAWLVVLVPYVHGSAGRRRVVWALVTSLAFGAALAISTYAVALPFVVGAHHALVRPRSLRVLARGLVRLPTALLAMAVLGPLVFVAMNPWLWPAPADRARDLLLAMSSPSFAPVIFRGEIASPAHVPSGFAPQLLVLALPTATIALAIAGATSLAHRGLTAPATRVRGGSLLAILVGGALVAPAVLPAALSAFPPPALLAAPFVAIAAGVGLDALAPLLAPRHAPHRGALVAWCALLPGALALASPAATWGAAVAPLAGGTRRIVDRGVVPVVDASLALELARALSQLGPRDVTVYAPDVPADVWEATRTLGQAKTQVRVVPTPALADAVVVPARRAGELSPAASAFGAELASVTRDGATLLVLRRRR